MYCSLTLVEGMCIYAPLDDSTKIDEQFTSFALLEDVALRGFPPLVSYQENLVYRSHSEETSTKQVRAVRVYGISHYAYDDLRLR